VNSLRQRRLVLLYRGPLNADVSRHKEEAMKYIDRLSQYFLAATCLSVSLAACTTTQSASGPGSAMTSLMSAAGSGSIDAARTLLDGGANVNEKDKSGGTPLMRAALNGRSEMVLFLLNRGGDAKATNNRGETALTYVGTRCISPDAAKALMASATNAKEEMHRALLNAATGPHDPVSCLSLVKFLVENGADLNYQSSYGNTALILASMWGHGEVVRFLLTKGANTSLKNKDGNTALDEAKNPEIRRILTDVKRGQQ
jgi:ankyrin repeat protein